MKVIMDTDLLGGSIRQVPERPQTVLLQTLAGACEVFTQSLHPTCSRTETFNHSALSNISLIVLSCSAEVDKKPLATVRVTKS